MAVAENQSNPQSEHNFHICLASLNEIYKRFASELHYTDWTPCTPYEAGDMFVDRHKRVCRVLTPDEIRAQLEPPPQLEPGVKFWPIDPDKLAQWDYRNFPCAIPDPENDTLYSGVVSNPGASNWLERIFKQARARVSAWPVPRIRRS